MSKPVLGIICCTRRIGTEQAQAVINRYVIAAMTYANTNAVLIPALPHLSDASDILARVDGLLLTGSPSNVQPNRYGDESDGEGPFDPGRDEMVLRLVEASGRKKVPIFGVCRGFQELNVAFGGTLNRDMSTDDRSIKHHAPNDVPFDAMFDHLHDIHLTQNGILARAYDREKLTVNSVHFQGVEELAPVLAVEATAPDGVVEAFSTRHNGAPVVAVQWHPEWRADDNQDSQIFFQLLGRALRGDTLMGATS
jgi:putative glutamine amidotransferase